MRPRFVLASASPRRRQLLLAAGYEFDVASPRVEEVAHNWLTIREMTIWNAARKAEAISRISPDAVVLAADTLVTIDGEVLGKPADFAKAVEMLRRLSGRVHEVWTAVRIVDAGRRKSRSFHAMSRVHFRSLDDRAVRNYLAKIDPLDKAGAYAAQGDGQDIIEKIEGSYTNVVGLPIEKTKPALALFGVRPSRPV
ncbi:MAG TPA: nucleoside triphosphate pyrophosphatase [Chthoniobacterales bacterium]|nr:nucleoside triphosphate pyrophosphatase [Chthoniobacterales bacterium]